MASSGKRALVIGAASGMGAAAAQRLYDDGYELILADITADRLEDQRRRFNCRTEALDVTDPAALDRLVAVCEGGLDAVIHTAGLSMSMASFDRIMAVNLTGSALVLGKFAAVIRPGGAAVCLASIAGHMAGEVSDEVLAIIDRPLAPDMLEKLHAALPAEACIPGMAYALSKLGVLRLVQRACIDWGQKGARVVSVSPGVIATPMGELERNSNPGSLEAMDVAPVPRLGRPEEIAGVIAFLASDQAAYITGTDLIVDGGWVGAIRSGPDSPIALAMANARAKE